MLRASQVMQLTVLALLGLGVVMVHSAGMSITTQRFGPLATLTSKDTILAGLAVLAMVLGSRVNIRHFYRTHGWTNPLVWALVLSLGLLAMTLVPGLARERNGAARWLQLGGVSLQPSEMVKWVMVLVVAWWCARRQGVLHRALLGLAPIGLLIAVACGLIVKEDLGTAALIGLVGLCMLVAGGARLWQLGLVIPPAVGVLIWAILSSAYRRDRILAFLHPWNDPQGIGYHPIQSMLAFAQGGLFGRGLGNGIQKFGYLPEDTTDFIFPVICEELGLAGAVLVIGLYLVLLWVGLGIVKECKDTFGRLVGLGVLLMVGLQALINIAVVTVVVPTKGIALPLLSAGGTGWVLTAFALGLVASLDEANRLEPEMNRADLPLASAPVTAGPVAESIGAPAASPLPSGEGGHVPMAG